MNNEINEEDYKKYYEYAHWNMEYLFINYDNDIKKSLLYPQIGKDMLIFLCNTYMHDKRLNILRAVLPCCGKRTSIGRYKETTCLFCRGNNNYVYVWDDSEYINDIRNPQMKYFDKVEPYGTLRLKE